MASVSVTFYIVNTLSLSIYMGMKEKKRYERIYGYEREENV